MIHILDIFTVRANTYLVNTLLPLFHKLRAILESRFHPTAIRRRRVETQLEFPWRLKR